MVGALAVHAAARAAGLPSVVGGLTWERRPIDPLPGPRRLSELSGVRMLHPAVGLASARTTGPGGVRFAEGRVAQLLGEPTVIVDPNPGSAQIADGLAAAATAVGADTIVLLDVGGNSLAHGTERGLASPLAHAVLLATAPRLRERHGLRVVGAIFGAGCDGELSPAEVAARLAEVAAAGGDLGHIPLDTAALTLLEQAVAVVPTEASALALRCASGHIGLQAIRNGARQVELTPAGGIIACFDPEAALRSAARMAALVLDASDLEAANALIRSRGVRTELAHERDAAADGPRGGL